MRSSDTEESANIVGHEAEIPSLFFCMNVMFLGCDVGSWGRLLEKLFAYCSGLVKRNCCVYVGSSCRCVVYERISGDFSGADSGSVCVCTIYSSTVLLKGSHTHTHTELSPGQEPDFGISLLYYIVNRGPLLASDSSWASATGVSLISVRTGPFS